MAYTLDISISLGSSYTDKTLNGQLVTTAGVNTGDPITSGFTHIGNGCYIFHYSSWVNGFRGGLKIFESGQEDILAFVAINPEEVEYCNADVSSQFSDTNDLIGDAEDKVDSVIAQTNKLRFTGATGSEEVYASATVDTTDLALSADLATVDTVVDAIKVQTDLFTFTGNDVKATLNGETVTTDAASRTAAKADVSALATAAAVAAVPTAGEIDTQLTSGHGSGSWLRSAGSGSTLDEVSVTDGSDPIAGVTVRVTSDESGNTLIATGITDIAGKIDFYHDESVGTTVYIWLSASGWAFDNPTSKVIS